MNAQGTQAMFKDLFRFVDHSIRERGLLINALNADKRDDGYQAKVKAFHNGEVAGHAPIGRTIRLISDINLAYGCGERDKAYQAATAEADPEPTRVAHLLPKLEAANSAHRELCSQAMDLADQDAGSDQLTLFAAHCDAFNALTDLVNSRATKSDAARPVEGQDSEANLKLISSTKLSRLVSYSGGSDFHLEIKI